MGWERLRGSNGGVIRSAVTAIAAVLAIVPPAVALQTAAAATSATSTPATSATPAPAQEPLAGLDAYIRESMPDWDVPGLAVAVVYNDEVVFARGFGVKELGRDDPVDAHTLFQIGSVTKSFAAGAIGALVDDGLVSWDDPVVKHLPWFRVRDPWVTREMTIRDLLSHRSGMPGDAYPVLAVMDARQAAERLRLPDNQAPLRQGFRYSNQAYGVAGLVVEAVTGTSWGDWVRERLLLPLEMHESVTSPYDVWDDPHVASTFLGVAPAGRVGIDDAPGRNVAMPHGVGRDGERRVLPWQSYDNMQAAGSVVSNVADLANWMRMHIRQGLFNGEFVLEDSTVSEMQAPQIATEHTFAFADDHTGSYGMGWTRATFHDHLYLFHGGGIFGFPAYVAMLPGIGAGVVVLANGSMWTPYYPHQEIAAWVFARAARRRAARLARRDHGPHRDHPFPGGGGARGTGRGPHSRHASFAVTGRLRGHVRGRVRLRARHRGAVGRRPASSLRRSRSVFGGDGALAPRRLPPVLRRGGRAGLWELVRDLHNRRSTGASPGWTSGSWGSYRRAG